MRQMLRRDVAHFCMADNHGVVLQSRAKPGNFRDHGLARRAPLHPIANLLAIFVLHVILVCQILMYQWRNNMLSVRLPKIVEKRLDNLARKTGRTKTYYVREAIVAHLEDLEDTYIALSRLEKPAKRWSLEELEKKHDLEG